MEVLGPRRRERLCAEREEGRGGGAARRPRADAPACAPARAPLARPTRPDAHPPSRAHPPTALTRARARARAHARPLPTFRNSRHARPRRPSPRPPRRAAGRPSGERRALGRAARQRQSRALRGGRALARGAPYWRKRALLPLGAREHARRGYSSRRAAPRLDARSSARWAGRGSACSCPRVAREPRRYASGRAALSGMAARMRCRQSWRTLRARMLAARLNALGATIPFVQSPHARTRRASREALNRHPSRAPPGTHTHTTHFYVLADIILHIPPISQTRARGPHPQAPTRAPTRSPQAPPRALPRPRAVAQPRAPAPVRRARTWPPPTQSARPRPVAAARGGQWPGRRRPALAQARARTLAATQRARWSWQLAQARARTWPLPPPPPTPGPRPKAAARGARWP